MAIQYIKRLQMVFDFAKASSPDMTLPPGFVWTPWDTTLLADHARVKHEGFRDSMDAVLFPTFAHYDRCLRLMESISSSPSFEPQSTWLITHTTQNGPLRHVANIQGMWLEPGFGAIQNVAVLPEFRRRGLGGLLVAANLVGFRQTGAHKVSLEVTADNYAAIRVYQRLGFEVLKIVFKESYMDY